MRSLVFVLGLTLAATAAVGQDIPRLDVDGMCAAQGRCTPANKTYCSSPGHETFVKSCVFTQQRAYDTAKRVWPRLSAADRTGCAGRLNGALHDYRILSACALTKFRIAMRLDQLSHQGKFKP